MFVLLMVCLSIATGVLLLEHVAEWFKARVVKATSKRVHRTTGAENSARAQSFLDLFYFVQRDRPRS